MVALLHLRSDNSSEYAELIFPGMRKHLSALSPEGPHVAVGATLENAPVGLVYGDIDATRTGHVRSLFVRRDRRNQGIGSALINAIETEFRKLGCACVQLSYVTGRPSTEALERVLQKEHWDHPVPDTLICKTDARMLEWPAYKKSGWLTGEYTLFRWVDLTPEDRESILRTQAETHWIPDDLVPFQYEGDFEPLNSLGLKYRGQPVGWMITHRVSPDTIRYTCSFMRKDLAGWFRIAPIYQEAMRLQTEAGIPNTIFMVPYKHSAMVRFVKKEWSRDFATVSEARHCSKSLSAGLGQAGGC